METSGLFRPAFGETSPPSQTTSEHSCSTGRCRTRTEGTHIREIAKEFFISGCSDLYDWFSALCPTQYRTHLIPALFVNCKVIRSYEYSEDEDSKAKNSFLNELRHNLFTEHRKLPQNQGDTFIFEDILTKMPVMGTHSETFDENKHRVTLLKPDNTEQVITLYNISQDIFEKTLRVKTSIDLDKNKFVTPDHFSCFRANGVKHTLYSEILSQSAERTWDAFLSDGKHIADVNALSLIRDLLEIEAKSTEFFVEDFEQKIIISFAEDNLAPQARLSLLDGVHTLSDVKEMLNKIEIKVSMNRYRVLSININEYPNESDRKKLQNLLSMSEEEQKILGAELPERYALCSAFASTPNTALNYFGSETLFMSRKRKEFAQIQTMINDIWSNSGLKSNNNYNQILERLSHLLNRKDDIFNYNILPTKFELECLLEDLNNLIEPDSEKKISES